MKLIPFVAPLLLEAAGTIGITFINNQIIFAASSLFIALGLFLMAKYIINSKLKHLKGSSKLLGLISMGIVGGEIIYLGVAFGIFDMAIELIAYLGIGLWLFLIPFQTYLKNMSSGISNYVNSEIDIGDIVEIKGKKGVIIEFHLTKTILLTEDGRRISVPNHRFSEDVVAIYPKTSKDSTVDSKSKTSLGYLLCKGN